MRSLILFEKLFANPEYYDVVFDPLTSGLKATHIHHNFDPAFGELEKEARDILYRHGHTVVLESERATELGRKIPDGLLNGNIFEIKTVLGTGKNNIKHKLLESRSQGCSHVILYYPIQSLFSHESFDTGYRKYKGVLKMDGSTNPLTSIWAIVSGTIVVLK
ncbi:MAG: hypothetical protein EOP52_07650 [Sphingobacteriales bacterium]|nr:MAG: hypothetical protein EOP52_07650 [Sphingobacteriales bacterium]